MAEQNFTIGRSKLAVPEGWRVSEETEDKLVFCSPKQQQATIGLMRFAETATFDQFETLCDLRVKAERKFLTNGYVEKNALFQEYDLFGMFFYGADTDTGRMFFCYMSLAHRELVTIYVEG